MSVVCPTSTPATSVIALSVPGAGEGDAERGPAPGLCDEHLHWRACHGRQRGQRREGDPPRGEMSYRHGGHRPLRCQQENAMSALDCCPALAVACAPAVFAQSHTLIVLSHRNHVAYELIPGNRKVRREHTAPDQPHEATVSPDGRRIFVAVPQGPTVEILEGESLKPVGRIESPEFKRTPVQTPNGLNSNAAPHGIAVTEDGGKVYVGLENADVPGVVVIDAKAGKVVRKIDLLLQGGHYLAIQPGTGKLYYPHRDDDRVVVLDTKTDRVLKVVPVKGGPVGVAFRPNGEVWLHEDGDGSVTVLDSKTDAVVQVIPTGGKGAGRIAVSPDGRFAASTHGGTQDVAIIDNQPRGDCHGPLGEARFLLFCPTARNSTS
jgi:YVTN family beta-propeller protein